MDFSGDNERFIPPAAEVQRRGMIKRIIGAFSVQEAAQPLVSDELLTEVAIDYEGQIVDDDLRRALSIGLRGDKDTTILAAAETAADYLIDNDFANQPTHVQVLSILNFAKCLDLKKIKEQGRDAPNARNNAIFAFTLDNVAEFMDFSAKGLAVADSISKRLEYLAEHSNHENKTSYGWLAIKANLVHNALLRMNYLDNFAAERSIDRVRRFSDAEKTAHEARMAEIFNQINRQRHYGVKDAFTKETIGGGSYLIFGDGPEFADNMRSRNCHPLAGGKNVAAVVRIRNVPTFDVEAWEDLSLDTSKKTIADRGYDMVQIKAHKDEAILWLGFDGELYGNVTGQMPLSDMFNDRSAYMDYIYLQAEIVSRYIELVAPAQVIERADLPPIVRGEGGEEQPEDVIRRLILPRLQLLGKQPKDPEDDRNERVYKEHNVTYHKRKLPNGYHASSEAIERALRFNIVLEEGETFVRKHTRGDRTQGEIKAHRLQ